MLDERIELIGSVDIAEDVQNRIKAVGVRGLSLEKAQELGVYDRISNLLCVIHTTIMAANRIYGGVAAVIGQLSGRKNEIAKTMNDFERAYEKFIKFWSDYYCKGSSLEEINEESEALLHHLMHWAQLPEKWNLGDAQRLSDPTDVVIKIEGQNNTDLTFHNVAQDIEIVGEPTEAWCVTQYNVKKRKQTTITVDMDKASALMVARRLSDEDKENIYTASIIRDVVEKRTEVLPYKAFKANETIGTIKKVFKKQ